MYTICAQLLCLSTLVYWSWGPFWQYIGLGSILALVPFQVTLVFEGLHQGRILCAVVANEHTLLTRGDSMVRPYVCCRTLLKKKGHEQE